METTTIASVLAAISSGSPISVLIGIIVVVFVLILPALYKFYNTETTQALLYNQLSERVQLQSEELSKQRLEIDRVFSQRNELYDEVIKLKAKVAHLESVETSNSELRETIELLKRKLNEKDRIIEEKGIKNTELVAEIMSLKDRIHNLELQLK